MLNLVMKPWMATCRETRARLSDYLEDDLGSRTRRRVSRHVARCKHCQAVLQSLTRTLDQLRTLGGTAPGPPEPATVRVVLERIRQDDP